MATDEKEIMKDWKEYYQKLLCTDTRRTEEQYNRSQ